MSERARRPGLEPDPESPEAVGRAGSGGTGGPGGPDHDMGGEIGPAGEVPPAGVEHVPDERAR